MIVLSDHDFFYDHKIFLWSLTFPLIINFFSDRELFLWSWPFSLSMNFSLIMNYSLIMNFFSGNEFFLWLWTFSLIMHFFSDNKLFIWSWTFYLIMNFFSDHELSLIMNFFSDHELILCSWTFSIRSWPCGRNHLHQLWLGFHVPHIQPSNAQQATGSVKNTYVRLYFSRICLSVIQHISILGPKEDSPPPPHRKGSPFSDTQPTF